VGAALGADKKVAKQPEASGKGIAVTIIGDREDGTVRKAVEGLKQIKANNPMLADPEKGQGVSAHVMAEPGTPSKRVAAVVATLLDAGISKITVEARK